MANRIVERVAIVTGASRGIGAEVARRLSSQGTAVVVNFARNADEAEAVVTAIERAGGRAAAVRADVADRHSAATLFDAAERHFGGVDVLINNAGVATFAPLAEMDDDAFDRVFATNVAGVFRLMREGARRLREGGRIISLSSSVVGFYQPRYGAYAASKAAVEALTRILAKEVARRNLTANAVAPGPVETDFFLADKSAEQVDLIRRMNPFGRLGMPEDIAGVVAWLAAPDAAWVSGQVLRVNGGVI